MLQWNTPGALTKDDATASWVLLTTSDQQARSVAIADDSGVIGSHYISLQLGFADLAWKTPEQSQGS